MHKLLVPICAALVLGFATAAAGGIAFSQTAAPGAAAPEALSAEDQNAAPFPAGRHAALVKAVCSRCHSAKLVTDQRYGREDAERFYKNMVSKDLTTEQSKQVIEYLTTALGQ